MSKDKKKPVSVTASVLGQATTPKQMGRALHHLLSFHPKTHTVDVKAVWELGQPVQSKDHLKLAQAVLRRLRKAAKRVSTPETKLENSKCQALCKVAIQEFEQQAKN